MEVSEEKSKMWKQRNERQVKCLTVKWFRCIVECKERMNYTLVDETGLCGITVVGSRSHCRILSREVILWKQDSKISGQEEKKQTGRQTSVWRLLQQSSRCRVQSSEQLNVYWYLGPIPQGFWFNSFGSSLDIIIFESSPSDSTEQPGLRINAIIQAEEMKA